MRLVHQCLHNTPNQRPSAEELLQQLEAVRAQIEGPYGQSVRVIVDMEKVRVLRGKDAEIERLRQQVRQLQVSVWNLYKCVYIVFTLYQVRASIVDWEIFMLETIHLKIS